MTENKVRDIEKRTDYEAILKEFGISNISDITQRIGKDYYMFRRNIVFAHRDFNKILDITEEGKSWAIVSGRGPSNDLHFGHLVVFKLIKYLQKKYDCHYFIPFSDDEKYVFNKVNDLGSTYKVAIENAIDIFSIGFDPEKTHGYISSKDHKIYELALKFSTNLTYNTIKSAFGFEGDENPGAIFYSCIQAAHILQPTVDFNLPVVVPIGLDQDVYIRLTRDIAGKRKINAPASLYTTYLKGLTGGPMSSSIPETCIYLRDTKEQIREKVMSAFTGGRTTIKEQRELGGVPEICTVYDWFKYLFVTDDQKLNDIKKKCKNGDVICGLDCKPKLINMILEYQDKYMTKRKEVIEDIESYFEHEIDKSLIEI